MVPFSLFLAMKYLKPKRSFVSVVTVISVTGVTLGVAILVIVLSVMTGFDDMWRQKILSFKPHLTVSSRYGVIEQPEEVCARVEAIDGVVGAAPSIETRVMIQHAGHTAAPVVVGLDPVRAARISRVPEHIERGRFDIEGSRMVMGTDLARQMGIDVGSEVLVYSPMNVLSPDEMYLPEEVAVSGLFNMGMRDYDANFLITSLDVAGELVGLDRGAYSVYVMIEDPFRFGEVAERVRAELGPRFEVRSWKDIDRLLFDALSHEKTMMFVLLVFITIVAIFCVTNTLIVITVQKTNEIGLLKALGFSSSKIMGAFVWHGLIQCMAGTAAGLAAGLLVLHNLARLVALLLRLNIEVFPKAIYGLSEIPWSTWPAELGRIALFVMVFCTLSSILPAYRAARLDPIVALRHD